jgi:hypothetical protein
MSKCFFLSKLLSNYFWNKHVQIYRFIAVDGEDIPVGVFKKRKDVIRFTIKELVETGHIVLPDLQDTPDTVVVYYMVWNQVGLNSFVFTIISFAKLYKLTIDYYPSQSF